MTLDETERGTLAPLADLLIPARAPMPVASDADARGEWLDLALRSRPDLVAHVREVLGRAAGREPGAELRRLQTEEPKSYVALATIVAGAYYMAPEVRALVGYPGQKPTLPADDQADRDIAGGVLDPVTARGPIYRPTPSTPPRTL